MHVFHLKLNADIAFHPELPIYNIRSLYSPLCELVFIHFIEAIDVLGKAVLYRVSLITPFCQT